MFKKIVLFIVFILLLGLTYVTVKVKQRIHPKPRIEESGTGISGIASISISVGNYEKMLEFYRKATGFELVSDEYIRYDSVGSVLYQYDSLSYRLGRLKGPNTWLEIIEYGHNKGLSKPAMAPEGPGMTHTCYQFISDSGQFDKFIDAGIAPLTRGGELIDLGGYGVKYFYGYDPEGNMIELEEMSPLVGRLSLGKKWLEENQLWITQVAILTDDISKVIDFYEGLLMIPPYRHQTYPSNSKIDSIANIDSLRFEASWFGMDGPVKKFEFMNYLGLTKPSESEYASPTKLGYSYSLEVNDIDEEYRRLKSMGVRFTSPPIRHRNYIKAIALDVDGNCFMLQQNAL